VKIADLFVNIGIGGAEKSVRSLSNVDKSMGNIASTSLEAKAAIIGMVYALQRLSASSNAQGTALNNFALTTGMSTKRLQQFQHAGRQYAATNDEMTNSLVGLQKKMTDIAIGGGTPKGMPFLAQHVGLPKDIENTEEMFFKLQEFATKFKNDPSKATWVLDSFGIGKNLQAGMFDGGFNEKVFSQANAYSTGQIKSLNEMRKQWTNLFEDIEHRMGQMNIKWMSKMLPDIQKLVTEVFKMVDAFSALAEKLEIIKAIGMVFEGWGLIFKGITYAVSGEIGNNLGTALGEAKLNSSMGNGTLLDNLGLKDYLPKDWKTSNKSNQNNVTNNNNFYGNIDPVRAGKSIGNETTSAIVNIPQEVN